MRVLTRFGPQAGPTGTEVKAAWAPDDRTVIIIVDPSSPNILAFNTGQAVEQLLRRTFFIELQSRYGNKFYVRDEVLHLQTVCSSAAMYPEFPLSVLIVLLVITPAPQSVRHFANCQAFHGHMSSCSNTLAYVMTLCDVL